MNKGAPVREKTQGQLFSQTCSLQGPTLEFN